ncbi:hypothetical protein [Ensifer sp. 4252]|uniref:hypothetical protein n=1 Tax=Ensifer sp. 4252 TaxID=3373915 RepID=UPI003D1A4465
MSTDYRANFDAAKLGLAVSAIAFATLREASRETVSAFDDALPKVPETATALAFGCAIAKDNRLRL